jgi:hypothetical protein
MLPPVIFRVTVVSIKVVRLPRVGVYEDAELMIKQNIALCNMRVFSVYWLSEVCIKRVLEVEKYQKHNAMVSA